MSGDRPVLTVEGLEVVYGTSRTDEVGAVRGVDLSVRAGEVVALVGESGSGKSTTAHAVAGLLPARGRVSAGRVRLGADARTAIDLTATGERGWSTVRGARIGLVPQDPGTALNPVLRIGDQIAEVLRIHGRADRRTARARAVEILRSVGLTDPEARARQHPHELSGGMRQRVLIGIALACSPELVIADEPTSALDVTVQRTVLDLLGDLTRRAGTAVLLITHDLALAAERADRVVVMKDGRVVEEGSAGQVLRAPTHDYTRELVAALPGSARTPRATVRTDAPAPTPPAPPLLVVDGLSRAFALGGRRSGRTVRAVQDVSFSVPRGTTLALVGESGSGKSTTARLVLGLTRPDAGTVHLDGIDVVAARGGRLREVRRRTQLVHQNPYTSLDPRFSVAQVVDEPLRAAGVDRAARRRRVLELLDQVRLPTSTADRSPAQLSGGQRQRVAIARALALSPELLVLDEPTSALDVSVQAQVLDLLAELRAEQDLTYLFVTHDLAVVQDVADHVGVMKDGRLVELGPTADVFTHPQDPCTVALLDAAPRRPVLVTAAPAAPAHEDHRPTDRP